MTACLSKRLKRELYLTFLHITYKELLSILTLISYFPGHIFNYLHVCSSFKELESILTKSLDISLALERNS